MSELTDALERISTWLEQHHPNLATQRPGLTIKEIENQAQDLPFQLSREIREMYQWHNGTLGSFFYSWCHRIAFFSLENAIKETEEAQHISSERNIPGFHMFCAEDAWYPFVACDDEEVSPVFTVGDAGEKARLLYTSLTSMMLTIAECYEKRILKIGKSGYVNTLHDERDSEKYYKIFQKYYSLSEQKVICQKYEIMLPKF